MTLSQLSTASLILYASNLTSIGASKLSLTIFSDSFLTLSASFSATAYVLTSYRSNRSFMTGPNKDALSFFRESVRRLNSCRYSAADIRRSSSSIFRHIRSLLSSSALFSCPIVTGDTSAFSLALFISASSASLLILSNALAMFRMPVW